MWWRGRALNSSLACIPFCNTGAEGEGCAVLSFPSPLGGWLVERERERENLSYRFSGYLLTLRKEEEEGGGLIAERL